MKFSEINFESVKDYLVCADEEDKAEINLYITAAKSFVMEYTALNIPEIDEKEYLVMPTLMLIATFYENKSIEMTEKINYAFTTMLNLGKVHSL